MSWPGFDPVTFGSKAHNVTPTATEACGMICVSPCTCSKAYSYMVAMGQSYKGQTKEQLMCSIQDGCLLS